MRKYMAIAFATCLTVAILTGCNGKSNQKNPSETTTQSENVQNLDAKKYVKLGEYKGLTIKSQKDVSVTEEQIAEVMNDYAADYMEYQEVTDRDTVKKDDTIEVSIQCLVAGQLDDDYSGDDIQIKVGAKDFAWIQDVDIDIDDDLIGAKRGETVRKEFQYPDNYAYDNYAGKDCVLEVTIHRIIAGKIPKITDAWVKENLEVDSVKVWKEQIREELEVEAKEEAEGANIQNMWEQIEKNSQQIEEFPTNVVKEQVEQQQTLISQNAAYLDMDEEEYRNIYMDGLTIEEYVKQSLFDQCIKDLIVEEENLSVSDEELKEYLEANIDGTNFSSTDEVMEFMGGEKAVKTEILNTKVDTFLKKANAFE